MAFKTTLDHHQLNILDKVSGDKLLADIFYFTGGTALSEIYLHHRESIDLDFFSLNTFNPQAINDRIERWANDLGYKIESEYIDPVYIYFLTFESGHKLKVDFGHYPYVQLGKPSLYKESLKIDSLLDIATNKLLTTTQRTEVKDYVDLYFLLKEFTFWDLKTAVETKFKIEIDPFIFASDCMIVEEFDFLPRMIKPLELDQLRSFFKTLAEKLGRRSIE